MSDQYDDLLKDILHCSTPNVNTHKWVFGAFAVSDETVRR